MSIAEQRDFASQFKVGFLCQSIEASRRGTGQHILTGFEPTEPSPSAVLDPCEIAARGLERLPQCVRPVSLDQDFCHPGCATHLLRNRTKSFCLHGCRRVGAMIEPSAVARRNQELCVNATKTLLRKWSSTIAARSWLILHLETVKSHPNGIFSTRTIPSADEPALQYQTPSKITAPRVDTKSPRNTIRSTSHPRGRAKRQGSTQQLACVTQLPRDPVSQCRLLQIGSRTGHAYVSTS